MGSFDEGTTVIDNGTMKVDWQLLTCTEEFKRSDVSPIARGHDSPVYPREFADVQFLDILLAEWWA